MWEGFQEAVKGGYLAIQNPKFRQHFVEFVKAMGVILLVMYAIAAVLLLIYLPITLLVLTWAPGLIAQLLTVMPLWAFVIAKKRTPMPVNQLFLDELEGLSPQRAKELEQQMKNEDANRNWMEAVYHDLRTSWHFTRASLMSGLFHYSCCWFPDYLAWPNLVGCRSDGMEPLECVHHIRKENELQTAEALDESEKVEDYRVHTAVCIPFIDSIGWTIPSWTCTSSDCAYLLPSSLQGCRDSSEAWIVASYRV